jgi:hypothetical protein
MESFDRISPCLTQLCKNLNCFYFIVNFEVRGFDWLTFALTVVTFYTTGPWPWTLWIWKLFISVKKFQKCLVCFPL